MAVKDLIREVLYEEKTKGLKLWYDVNIFIQGFVEPGDEEEPKVEKPPVEKPPVEEPPPSAPALGPATAAPAPLVASTKYNGKILNEDIYKMRAKGELFIPREEAENIQTLEDLLDYLSDKRIEGKPIINALVTEIILTLAGTGTKTIEEIVKKGDRVRIDIKYGGEIGDSIGIKVNKNSGSDTITMSMSKDNKILSGAFDLAQFNKILIFYRNSLASE